jgi:hypothetical protein
VGASLPLTLRRRRALDLARAAGRRVAEAGLAFAACMRAHGVPHPDPDRNGDFNLTPAQEHRLRVVGMAKVRAADNACFKYLKRVVSTKPLSAKAKAQARHVLEQVRTCPSFGTSVGAVPSLGSSQARLHHRPRGR